MHDLDTHSGFSVCVATAKGPPWGVVLHLRSGPPYRAQLTLAGTQPGKVPFLRCSAQNDTPSRPLKL